MRYLDADTLSDARNALGCMVPIDVVAAHIGVTVSELRHALNMPPLKDEPRRDPEAGGDLFDRLSGGNDDEKI